MSRIIITTLLLVLFSTQSIALDLQQAKAQGLVGETPTGYIAAVSSSADVNALVQDINAKRKQQYQKIAKDNGISLQAVEKRAGQKAIERTAAGHYYNNGGSWVKK